MDSDRVQRLENCGARDAAAAVGEHADQGPRTPPTRSTCTGSPRRSPSTPCPTRRSRRSTTTARWGSRCRADGGDCDALLARFSAAGVDWPRSPRKLQRDGAKSFVDAWNDLMARSRRRATRGLAEGDSMTTCHCAAAAGVEGARAQHHAEIARTSPARPVRRGPGPRGAADAPRPSGSTSTTRRTASPTRRCACCSSSPRSPGCEQRTESDVPRRAHQRLREPLGAARRAAHAEGHLARRRRRRRRRPRCTRCSTGWRDFAERVRSGEWKGHTGKPHPQRRQHRHRRLRPRAGDGLRGAAPLHPARPDVPFRLERRLAPTSSRRRATSTADETLFIVSSKTFGTLETLTNAHVGARVGRRQARRARPRSPSTSSRSRPTPSASPSSASTPRTCSASGTGSAAATRWTPRSACRRCSPSARSSSARCSPASTRWTSTSVPRRSRRTCRC